MKQRGETRLAITHRKREQKEAGKGKGGRHRLQSRQDSGVRVLLLSLLSSVNFLQPKDRNCGELLQLLSAVQTLGRFNVVSQPVVHIQCMRALRP
jgi:hypothetical protein